MIPGTMSPGRVLALTAIVASFAVLPAGAQAPSSTYKGELSLADVPRDVAVTPNGALAVVRCNSSSPSPQLNDEISVWRCSNGQRAAIQNMGPTFGKGTVQAGYASDALAVTNNWAVAIGEGGVLTQDPGSTYIEVITLSGGPPTSRSSYKFPQPGGQDAGLVSDVAITPNETWAVVHSQNWIHLIDLVNDGEVLPVTSLNIGGLPAGACYPGPQSDSVAVTNSHAVVVTTRDFVTGLGVRIPHAWVYVVDLTSNPPTIRLGQLLQMSDTISSAPHDVAITLDDSLAVVSCNEYAAAVWLTNPAGPSILGQMNQLTFKRSYGLLPQPVDSVEVTNDRALLISQEEAAPGVGPLMWAIHVLQLRDSFGVPSLGGVATYRSSQFIANTTDQPHDLAISENAGTARAVVKTTAFDVLIPTLATALPLPPDPNGILLNPSLGKPQSTLANVFVSDSVSLHPGAIFSQVWAVTIGNSQNQSSGKWEARVHAWDILHPASKVPFPAVTNPDFDVVPADAHRHQSGLSHVVHCYAPPDDPGSGSGRDWLRYLTATAPPSEQARFGASGDGVLALDSIAVGTNSVTSVSEYMNSITPVWGYVHFVEATP